MAKKKKEAADQPAAPSAASAGTPAAGGAAQAAPTVETSAPPSKTLERALKLYDSEDYYSSSIELNKVVERQSGDDEGNTQRAEFFMGKTLFNLKFYSASSIKGQRTATIRRPCSGWRRSLDSCQSRQACLRRSASTTARIWSSQR